MSTIFSCNYNEIKIKVLTIAEVAYVESYVQIYVQSNQIIKLCVMNILPMFSFKIW